MTQEHCARLLTHHPGAAGPGEVWVTTRVVPAKTAARVPGPGSSPRAAAAPLLGCDLVFTARSPWLVGLRRWGSQAETLLGLPPWEGEGVETDRTQLGLLPAWSPPPPKKSFWSGLCCSWPSGSSVWALAGPGMGWGFLPHLRGRRGAWVGSASCPALLDNQPTFLGLCILVCKGV